MSCFPSPTEVGTSPNHKESCLTRPRLPFQSQSSSYKANLTKLQWEIWNSSPGTSRIQGTFKDEFLTKQCSSAWCLAVDFNSFQQNRCRAAGAGDFEATKPEGSLDEYVNRGQGFISRLGPTWALQLPSLSSYFPPLRHWSQCVSPWGYKCIKEQETNY